MDVESQISLYPKQLFKYAYLESVTVSTIIRPSKEVKDSWKLLAVYVLALGPALKVKRIFNKIVKFYAGEPLQIGQTIIIV